MKPAAGQQARAFTLVEMLVAFALFLMLIGVTAILFNHTSNTISQSNKTMDALNAEQEALGRMHLEISRMLLRDDVNYGFLKQPGDDLLSFYSLASGFNSGTAPVSTPRPLSSVNFGIAPDAKGNLRLTFSALSIDWSPSGNPTSYVVVPNISGTRTQSLFPPNNLPAPTTADLTTLSGDVIRFEYCFLLKQDLTQNPPLPPRLSATPPSSLEAIAAIVVAVVVVDSKSRQLFPPGADVALAQKFPDAVDGQDLLSLWTPVANDTNQLRVAGIPQKAIAGIRIYQRYCLLPW